MPARTIACPICASPMQKRVVNNGIEIDYCDWHGVWLDAGELERLFAAYNGGQRATPSHGVGKGVMQGLAGAAVMGAGFGLGSRIVGGILDALFNRQG